MSIIVIDSQSDKIVKWSLFLSYSLLQLLSIYSSIYIVVFFTCLFCMCKKLIIFFFNYKITFVVNFGWSYVKYISVLILYER